jgi:Dyp-type peroxidase family
MPNINNRSPVDPRSAEYEGLLRNLQGNILKGHGREFTANIFLQFHVTGEELKAALRSLTEQFVTSAHEQMGQRNRHLALLADPGASEPDPLFGNLFLSRHAYTKLGLGDCLCHWFDDSPGDIDNPPPQSRFRTGMLVAHEDLGDELNLHEPLEPLEIAYLNGTIDALLLLANDSDSHLIDIADRLTAELASQRIASRVAIEFGRVMSNDRGQGIEHFGYADGISQPLFFTSDFEKLQQVESVDRWDPFAPLKLALLRDPGVNDEHAFGSYYVFRKLEQNVRAFHAAEAELACELGLRGADESRAGAMIVGRFRDGTPLALSGAAGPTTAGANNFRYDGLLATLEPDYPGSDDHFGLKCPFQAHIRKTNPRQSQDARTSTPGEIKERNQQDRDRRIVRRGIPYGIRSATEQPEQGVGLLFGCFQSSIVGQYAFIQRNWANTATFRIPGSAEDDLTGLDPLIGQPLSRRTREHHWRRKYGGCLTSEPETLNDLNLLCSHPKPKRVGDFVRFRGGEFLFAPSLPFLLGH